MARPFRIEKVGVLYLSSLRPGNERKAVFRNAAEYIPRLIPLPKFLCQLPERPIFCKDADRRHFLEVLAEMVERYWVRLAQLRADG